MGELSLSEMEGRTAEVWNLCPRRNARATTPRPEPMSYSASRLRTGKENCIALALLRSTRRAIYLYNAQEHHFISFASWLLTITQTRPHLLCPNPVSVQHPFTKWPTRRGLGPKSPTAPKICRIGSSIKRPLLGSIMRWNLEGRMASCKSWNRSTTSKRRMFSSWDSRTNNNKLFVQHYRLTVMQGKPIQETICQMGCRHEAHQGSRIRGHSPKEKATRTRRERVRHSSARRKGVCQEHSAF
jgi:hypothetical protein